MKKIIHAVQLFKEAFPQYNAKIAVMAILGFLSGALEGIGVNAIIPLFSLMNASVFPMSDSISAAIRNTFIFLHIPFFPSYIAAFIFALFVLKAIVLFGSQYVTLRIMTDYEVKARNELFGELLNSKWSYLLRQKVGYLDQVLLSNINASSGILFHLGSTVLVLTNLSVYTILVLNISPLVAFLSVVFGATVFLCSRPAFIRLRRLSHKIVSGYKDIGHYINEHLIGMKTVKTSGASEAVAQGGTRYFMHQRSLRIKMQSLQNIINCAFQPMGVLFILLTFGYFAKSHILNIASFAVVVYELNRVFIAVQGLQSEAQEMYTRLPHLLSVLEFQREVRLAKEVSSGNGHFVFRDSIAFEQVHFNYHDTKKVLHGITLTVRKGEMVGIIGLSGAGKTTLVDLLLRLFTPSDGEILLDGIPIEDINIREWQEAVGYVPQDIFLLNGTIEENIRFYDITLSKDALVEAAKMAQCYDFITALPKQFGAPVGERGVLLSGGQRQRIALARVLARKPQLLILDEATSALDQESESLIQTAIEGLRGNVTVIVIAHRLSTIMNSDRLFVLEKGKVAEEGKPDELLKRSDSRFSQLYQSGN